MISRTEFLELVQDELPTLPPDLTLDEPVHLSSLQVLRLAKALEKVTGNRLPVGRLITEETLDGVYRLVTAG